VTDEMSLAVGWATIDRDAPVAGWAPGDDLAADPILGAAVRSIDGVDGLVLLEPSTEGRVAASLARSAEGPAAIYVRVRRDPAALRRTGLVLSALATGPFGRQALVLGGSRFGPHVVAVLDPATDTIAR
jgi:hypothetical protein